MKRPPYLIRVVSRHGKLCWYVHRRPGPRIRIHGEYGSRAFMAAYRAALYEGAKSAPEEPDNPPETLAALICAYKRSPAWTGLAQATRRTRGNMLDRIIAKAGDMPSVDVDRQMVVAGRDSMNGPGAAKCFIDTLRGLFKWAVDTGIASEDPTQGVKGPTPKTEGWHTWTDADIDAYERRWPIGTRERLWLVLLLHTGLRLSDALKLSAAHISDGTIELTTGKTGTPVFLPLAPELKDALSSTPLGKKSFIGMSAGYFDKQFRAACREAGVEGSAHGLRKAAATKLAEAGATVLELNAIFGWVGAKMALRYSAAADRAKLAQQGLARLRATTLSKDGKNSRIS